MCVSIVSVKKWKMYNYRFSFKILIFDKKLCFQYLQKFHDFLLVGSLIRSLCDFLEKNQFLPPTEFLYVRLRHMIRVSQRRLVFSFY